MRKRELAKMINEMAVTLKTLNEVQQEEALKGLLAELSNKETSYELKVVKVGHCEVCGKPLEPSNKRGSVRLFCSLSCKQKSYRERVKAEKGE